MSVELQTAAIILKNATTFWGVSIVLVHPQGYEDDGRGASCRAKVNQSKVITIALGKYLRLFIAYLFILFLLDNLFKYSIKYLIYIYIYIYIRDKIFFYPKT